jgi:single-strand DNA-binding protein
MAGDTPITLVGNLTADPELRFTPSGAAVANFTVASTPRQFDRQANDWKDGETLFMRCSIWREAAENVAESLHRGARVVVTGRLVSRSWETPEGEKRTVMEMQADEVGPSLKYATAKVTKAQRGGGGGGGFQGGGQQGGFGGAPAAGAPQQGGQQPGAKPAETDPWATGGTAGGQQGGGQQGGGQQGGGWGGAPSYDEPPF